MKHNEKDFCLSTHFDCFSVKFKSMELCLRLWLQYLKVSDYLCALSGFYINWKKK